MPKHVPPAKTDHGAQHRLAVALLSSAQRPAIAAAAEQLAPRVAALADLTRFDLQAEPDLEHAAFDLAIVVGGDGSILRAARLMGSRQRPVLGINFGKLGFLADMRLPDFEQHWPSIAAGPLQVCEHLMFNCELLRAGAVLERVLALNEVAVLSGSPFAMLDVDLYVDSELVTTYSCDGLLVSTPVGSTAHSLSAGGPILRQDLQALAIVPLSPHTLSHRPVIDSANRLYELVAPRPGGEASLVVDGRLIARLEPDDRVRICKSAVCFQRVVVPGLSYYRTLREKLGWGGRLGSPE